MTPALAPSVPHSGTNGAMAAAAFPCPSPLAAGGVSLAAPRVGGGGQHSGFGISTDRAEAAQGPRVCFDDVVTAGTQLAKDRFPDARLHKKASGTRRVRRR